MIYTVVERLAGVAIVGERIAFRLIRGVAYLT